MTQKIIKVGNSVAVVIPKKSLKELGVRLGDEVSVKINKKSRRFSFEPTIKEIDQELLSWTKRFIKHYRPALEALSKK